MRLNLDAFLKDVKHPADGIENKYKFELNDTTMKSETFVYKRNLSVVPK